jgi:hypothetical protein
MWPRQSNSSLPQKPQLSQCKTCPHWRNDRHRYVWQQPDHTFLQLLRVGSDLKQLFFEEKEKEHTFGTKMSKTTASIHKRLT